MAKEKKDEGAGYPFKILLEESLEGKRNAMMDKFPRSFDGNPQATYVHLTTTLEAPLILKYKLILTFPYLRAR